MKIKTSTILACVLLGILNLQAQYQSIFGSEQTEWNYIALYCDAAFVDTYIHEKDTSISGIEYHVINDFGLLREAEDNSKLWFRGYDESEEILFLDLSLNIGDTFSIKSEIFIVDTTYLESDLKVIEFDYTLPNCGLEERFKFIEGRGTNLGYNFYITTDIDDTRLLRCHTKDTVNVNFLEYYFGSDCRKDLTTTIQVHKEDIQIFPNPFHDEITLQFEDNSARRVEIYNLSGIKLIEEKTSSEILNIATAELINGIYIVKVLSSNYLQSYKVIKI